MGMFGAAPDDVTLGENSVGNVLVSGDGSLLDTGQLLACGKFLNAIVTPNSDPPGPPDPADKDLLTAGGSGTIHVRDGGVVQAAEIVVGPGCVAFGDGTLSGNLTLEGTLLPGNSPGTLTVNGSMTLKPTGKIVLEVNGTDEGDFDILNVTGNLTLEEGSSIEIVVAPEVQVAAATNLTLVDATELDGTVEVQIVVEDGTPPPEPMTLEFDGSEDIGVTISEEGVLPLPLLNVQIDIKPGSGLNPINLGSQGVIRVAILSSAIFDATNIDPATVQFEGAFMREVGKGKLLYHAEDVDSDGMLDLVCQLETADLQIDLNAEIGRLLATTLDGVEISGQDSVQIVQSNTLSSTMS